jgi:hypothetical protein
MTWQVRGLILGVCSCCLVISVGCSKSDGRLAVSGTVNYKGAPLDQGTIQFIPTEANGTHGGSAITSGKYSIPAEQGLKAGKYRIVISSGEAGTAETPAMPGESGPPAKERIPPEYNRDSEKKPVIREVAAGSTQIDFDIK